MRPLRCSPPPPLRLQVDDNLINGGSKYRRVPRADVAEFCVQCLGLPEAANRSVRRRPGLGRGRLLRAAVRAQPKESRQLWTQQPSPGWILCAAPPQVDLASKEPGEGAPTADFAALLRAMPRNCDYSVTREAVPASA